MSDVGVVGGKNASLGEMIHHLTEVGVRVPGGFATTTDAFHLFLKEARLDERIHDTLEKLDVEDVHELARVGREIRSAVEQAPLPDAVASAVHEAFEALDEGTRSPCALLPRRRICPKRLSRASRKAF